MITSAVQKGKYAYVYVDNDRYLFMVYGELYGFTGTSVSVRKGNYIHVYNERGSCTATHYSAVKK